MKINIPLVLLILGIAVSCSNNNNSEGEDMSDVKLMTLDPGHFHAALVQKSSYDNVSDDVYVFAPEGEDVNQHLNRIAGFNTREENPTSWNEKVYLGDDFFKEMIETKPGNVVVLSGNNAKKTNYILACANEGINVLADKPMIINPGEFSDLENAFELAKEKGILIYDIMTERYEINTMLQKALSESDDVFGQLITGTPEEPAVTKESVHHFFKYVSGSALIRPAWFFDTKQQGEGIVDVTTHLVDLVQWECYPEVVLNKSDIQIISGRRWPTIMSPEEFKKVTGSDSFPSYLENEVIDGKLNTYANGEIIYKIKDTYAKVVVEWKYQAPEGTGDTHYSIMRGTKSDIIIKQGEEEEYKPTLYIKAKNNFDLSTVLSSALSKLEWKGISAINMGNGLWKLNVPDEYKAGHEAHFGQVTEKYLDYLKDGKLPDWEVPNMIVKYYTTTEGLKKALE